MAPMVLADAFTQTSVLIVESPFSPNLTITRFALYVGMPIMRLTHTGLTMINIDLRRAALCASRGLSVSGASRVEPWAGR